MPVVAVLRERVAIVLNNARWYFQIEHARIAGDTVAIGSFTTRYGYDDIAAQAPHTVRRWRIHDVCHGMGPWLAPRERTEP